MFIRVLDLSFIDKQSCFLLGARKTGKTTFLKYSFPDALFIDLLKSDLYLKYLKSPYLLREELIAHSERDPLQTVVIDEIQKVPLLLDEVHWLIENTSLHFILCGSSARKLRQKGVNLLGGRAWKFHFFPLIYKEIKEFDLLRALSHGLIPSHYLSSHPKRFLKAYVEDYLIQEIQAEGLVRNLSAFSRFLETASYSHAEMINYNNIARDVGVDAKTIKEYYQILEDTLVGYSLEPFQKKSKRPTIQSISKFYFFDPGVANYISKKSIEALKGSEAGKSFESYIFHELIAYQNLKEKEFKIAYWRTLSGFEVDFVLYNHRNENEVSLIIEVKITETISKEDIKGMVAFMKEYSCRKAIVVCCEKKVRKMTTPEGIEIYVYPYDTFLEELWADQFVV